MADFYYPLPPEKLKKRYAHLFEIVRKRQSGSFIGLPESAKSGYLQFLLQEKKIIHSLLPKYGSTHKILYFEPIPLIGSNPYHWLFQLSIKLEMLDESYKHVITEDPVIVLTNIQKYLLELASARKHLTIIIAKQSIFSKLPKEAGEALRSLWEIKRQPPSNPLSLIFLLHSKSPQSENLSEFYEPLRTTMNENIFYFPALDKEEMDYTVRRFSTYFNFNIGKTERNLLYQLSGGFYPLILDSIKLLKNIKIPITRRIIKSLISNKVLKQDLRNLWESFESSQKTEMIKASRLIPNINYESTLCNLELIDTKGRVRSYWIQSFVKNSEFKEILTDGTVLVEIVLKGKELLVYKYLLSQKGNVVSRGKIAEVLWGKNSSEKYSDWAIDKVISRIRKKLVIGNAAISIVTIRKQGFILLA